MTWQRATRHRWHRPLRIAVFALYGALPWMIPSPNGGGHDKLFAAVAFAVAMFIELIIKPRIELPASRVCPRCDASSAPNARACVFCGREWLTDEGPRYAPYLANIPAARIAHRRAVVVLIVLGAATLFPMFLNPSQFSMAGYFIVIYYAYDLITGTMLKRTHLSLIEHRGGLCTRCTYPLVETMSKCPECGVNGSVLGARRAWAESGLWHPDEATARDMVAAKASGASVGGSAEGSPSSAA